MRSLSLVRAATFTPQANTTEPRATASRPTLGALCIALLAAALLLPAAAFAQQVNFGSSGLQGETLGNPTSLEFGPDARLYVSQQSGTIFAYTIVRNGPNDYSVTDTETINLVQNIPNYDDDDGSLNTGVNNRQVTGLVVVGTVTNPVLYVSSSDPRIGAGGGGNDENLDTNSGVISRLTCVGGIVDDACVEWEKVDIVRGLPRSEENHASNGLDYDPATNTLYLAQGGHTNAGSPSNNFAFTTEYALAAAVLSIDLDAIEALPILTDAQGQDYIYDLPTVDDPTRPNVGGCVSAPGNPCEDVGDPWGGNDGLNQAKLVPGSPVQVYAGGFRNLYDIVITESGRMYGVDNGANAGWGGYPEYEESFDCTNNLVPGEPGSGGDGPNPADYPAGVTLLDGTQGTVASDGQPDSQVNNQNGLHLITEGYYGGHPTPLRGNPEGAGLWYNGTFYEPGNANLPVDWPAVPESEADPRECDFQNSGEDDQALANFGPSTNGITEYTASNFDGALQGDLLAAGFSGGAPIYHMILNEDGTVVTNCPADPSINCTETLFDGFGAQPLDVMAQGDDDPFPGTVWAAVYGPDNVQVFEPADYDGGNVPLCTGDDDPALDEDNDGFDNADEIDNGTDPCSAGSQPTDNDGDNISDLNDPDDDNDSLLDVDDSFALDADNGLATTLPLDYAFFNDTPGVTVSFFGLGFTGLMTNGTTDYLDQFIDPTAQTNATIAGGTAGILTIPLVTDGDAFQSVNTQENAFQFGIDAPDAPFTIEAQMNGGGGFLAGARENFASQGIFIGTGDQDNYLKLVLNDGSDGNGGFQVLTELGASTTTNVNQDVAGVLDATNILLFLSVDPVAGTVQPRYSQDGGPITDLGTPVTLTGALLDAVQGNYAINGVPSGLAVGVISTSTGAAPEFSATWDYFLIEEDPSDASAFVKVDTDGLNGSTFSNSAFNLENTSLGGVEIESVVFDLSTAIIPEVVFDPDGTAGDGTAKGFTLNNGSDGGTGVTNNTFGSAYEGGFYTLTVDFDDFQPGESVQFGADIDPISIKGGSAPGPNEAGSVSGLELAGATVTVTFSNGDVHVVELYRTQPDDDSDSENIVRNAIPTAPTVEVIGQPNLPATVFDAGKTIRVSGDPGSDVKLLVLEGGMFVEDLDGPNAGVGYDVDPFEVNSIITITEFDGTLDGSGLAEFNLTLTDSDPEAGFNYIAAVVVDDDGATSPLSNVAVMELDPDAEPVALFRVNANGPIVPATDGGIDWEAGPNSSPYQIAGGGGDSNPGPVNSTVTTGPNAVPPSTPLVLYETERWDQGAAPEMLWSFPTGNGTFTARLYMANGFSGTSQAGERIFDVEVEGVLEIDDLDLSGQFGHKVGVVFDIPVIVEDGNLDIEFLREVENPLINAIEILGQSGTVVNLPPQVDPIPNQVNFEGDDIANEGLAVSATDSDGPQNLDYSIAGAPPGVEIEPTNGQIFGIVQAGAAANSPYEVTVSVSDGEATTDQTFTWTVLEEGTVAALYRINAGGAEYLDVAGNTWEADNYFQNGSTFSQDQPIAGTADDELYQTERFGGESGSPALAYSIPTGNGTYDIELHFAEIFLGVSGSAPCLSGQDCSGFRVFDVLVEGAIVLDDYDVWAAAGASLTAVIETIQDVEVLDGTLDIEFTATSDNAKVSAIAVFPATTGEAPEIDPVADVTATEGDPIIDLAVSATDPQSDPITLSIEVVDDGTSTPVDPSLYTFEDNSDGTGTFTWFTQDGDAGIYTATVTASDGTNESTESFQITLNDLLPTIAITSPSEGATIVGDELTVTWESSGTLADDHVHVQLDDNDYVGSQPLNGSYTFTGVAPGPHTVTVTVANNLHEEYTNPEATDAVSVTLVEGPTLTVLHRINVGGPVVAAADASAPDWGSDTGNFGNAGNSPFLAAMSTGTSTYSGNAGNAHPGPIVMTDPSLTPGVPAELFNTERYDAPSAPEMLWQFPDIEPGTTIEVRLFFAELFSGIDGAGQRVFDVSLEGTVPAAFDDVDPFAVAGAKGAFVRSAQVTVDDGTLDIEFIHITENPAVKGIEVLAVGDAANLPPVVTNPGDQFGLEGDAVSLQIEATAPEGGQTLAYGATGLPPSLAIDPATGLITGTLDVGSDGTTGAFLEESGIVVIEMESADVLPGNWENAATYSTTFSPDVNNPDAASNDDFIIWQGGQNLNNPGIGQIAFPIEIQTPGTYQFQWRNQVGNGTNTTEHNDTWLKIEADAFYGSKNGGASIVCPKGFDPAENDCTGDAPNGSGSGGWFKIYSSGANNWSWSTNTSDNDAHQIFAEFDAAGTYTILISARSSSHAIDRLVLAKTDYSGDPQSLSLPESPRSSDPVAGAADNSPYNVTVTVTDDGEPALATDVAFVWTVGEPEGTPSALVQVTPGQGIGASTFGNNSFQVTNTGDVAITKVTFNARSTYMPDVVFDPVGTAGDAGAKCLTAGTGGNTPAEVGLTVPADGGSDAADCESVFDAPHNDVDDAEGYDVLTLDFTDFDAGESFYFGVDMDPTSIKGDLSTGDAGSISGFEIIGATVTIVFANGSTLTSSLFDESSLGGSQAVLAPASSEDAPVISTDVPLTPLDGNRAGATVTSADQTLTLTGPAEAAYTLLQVDTRLYIDPGNPGLGYDVDLLEANEAVAKALYTGTFDTNGEAVVPVTLLQTPGVDPAPDGGINHFVAVVDGVDGRTSKTSNVVILELEPTTSIAATYGEGWNLVSLPVEADDPDIFQVFEAGAGGDPASPVYVVPGTFFEFSGGYSTPDPPDMTPGKGAWLKFAQEANVNHEGGAIEELTLSFGDDGWFLIGPPSCSVPVSTLEDNPSIVAGTTFGYAGGYTLPSTLEPGQGYWVKVVDGTEPFDLPVSCAPAVAEGGLATARTAKGEGEPTTAKAGTAASRTTDLNGFATLLITDANGGERALRFDGALAEEDNLDRFAMPPLPPAGAFDARFAGDTRLVEGTDARVLVQTAAYPLRLELVAPDATEGTGEYELDVLKGDEVVSSHVVSDGAVVEVFDEATTLVLRAKTEALPEVFALVGAYPNPFRREATVAFDLPEAADVRVELYDLLGRRVSVLTEAFEAGAARSVKLSATGLGSGAYFFRVEAVMGSETVVETGRLTVIR